MRTKTNAETAAFHSEYSFFCFYSKENYTGPALSKMGVPLMFFFKGKSPYLFFSILKQQLDDVNMQTPKPSL